ncbi:TPA: hypothetical protein NJ228_002424 [Vibrio parahaemolyticus]|nr:hypothetical protein [Vibrio parahaemolyticus]
MKSLEVKQFIYSLPNETRGFVLQDVSRWVQLLNYKGNDPFVFFYTSRQEFRSLIRYRARIAQKKLGSNIVHRLMNIHSNQENVWVNNLYISCENIGPGLYIEHGFSTIIFAKSIGENFYVNQNVTIGTGKGGNPTIGNNVRCGANSVVIGDIFVADNVKIGAGAVLNFEVPADSTVVPQKVRVISSN